MSLKSQLTTRELPGVTQLVQIKDSRDARVKLEQALRVLKQAEIKGADLKRCRAAVTRAQNQLEACFAKVTLRALSPADYEALIEKHPPTAEQVAAAGKNPADRPEYNGDTFYPALFTACAEGDMTEDDWAAFFQEHVSHGERRQLYMAVLAVNENERMPEAMHTPKGLPGTGTWLSNLM